jgi:hypothetical protein
MTSCGHLESILDVSPEPPRHRAHADTDHPTVR